MAGVLKYTVVVRNPDTMVAHALKAGEPVPSWAKDLVHPDDLTGGSEKKAKDKKSKPDGSDETGAGSSEVADYTGSEWTKAKLEAEVESRNEDRQDDELIEVDAPGNKAELIAALEADDAAQVG